MKQAIIIVIGLIVAGALLVWWVGSNSNQSGPNNQISETPAGDADSFSTYRTDTGLAVDAEFVYPGNAEVSEVRDTIYEVKRLGANSRPDTDIIDGFYISLRFLENTTVAAYLSEQGVDEGATATIELAGQSAEQYISDGELGSQVTHLVQAVSFGGQSVVVDVAYTVAGSDVDGYLAQVQSILNSLTFVDGRTVTLSDDEQAAIEAMTDTITVATPATGTIVNSPISVSGEARGFWYFEASAPVTIETLTGAEIGQGFITAQGDWMTEEFVPFTGSISYTLPTGSTGQAGVMILRRDNPSGLPENDASVEIPLYLQ